MMIINESITPKAILFGKLILLQGQSIFIKISKKFEFLSRVSGFKQLSYNLSWKRSSCFRKHILAVWLTYNELYRCFTHWILLQTSNVTNICDLISMYCKNFASVVMVALRFGLSPGFILTPVGLINSCQFLWIMISSIPVDNLIQKLPTPEGFKY